MTGSDPIGRKGMHGPSIGNYVGLLFEHSSTCDGRR